MQKLISKTMRILLAFLIVIFLLQVNFDDFVWFQMVFYEFTMKSDFSQFFKLITFLADYIIIPLLYLSYFIIYFVIKPNIIDNTVNLTYICCGIFLINFLKLLIGEYQPILIYYLYEEYEIEEHCNFEFGNPNSTIGQLVLLYYLFRILFFDKQRHIILSENIQDRENLNFKNFFNFQKNKIMTEEGSLFISFNMAFKFFQILFYFFIILVIFSQCIIGEAFLTSTIMTLLLMFYYSKFFYEYLRYEISIYLADKLIYPNSRLRSTIYFIVISIGLQILASLIGFLRLIFRSDEVYVQLQRNVIDKCFYYYLPEENSIAYLFIFFFAILTVKSQGFFNLRNILRPQNETYIIKKDNKDYDIRQQLFWDLDRDQKMKRILIFTICFLCSYINYWLLDTVIQIINLSFQYTVKNIIIYKIFLLQNVILITIVIPYLLKKHQVLLKYEYLFEEDFLELETKKYDKKRLIMPVYFNDDQKKSFFEEIKGDKKNNDNEIKIGKNEINMIKKITQLIYYNKFQ